MEIYHKKNDQGSIFLGKNERLGSGNQCDVPSWDLVMLIILKTSNHCRVLFFEPDRSDSLSCDNAKTVHCTVPNPLLKQLSSMIPSSKRR